MLGSNHHNVSRSVPGRTWPRRRGGLLPLFLVMFGLLLALTALAVDGANLWSAHLEMQNSVDAAALAAAMELADDELLTGLPNVMFAAAAKAHNQAQAFAALNPVCTQPLMLQSNPTQHPQGDIVFGFYDVRSGAGFQPALSQELAEPTLNAVRITGRRTKDRQNPIALWFSGIQGRPVGDVVAQATAMLDRDVIGFRPMGHQTIPLMPLALLSDPTAQQEASWEYQTIRPTWSAASMPYAPIANDQFIFERKQNRFLPVGGTITQGNRIPEMAVRIPLSDAVLQDIEPGEEPNGCWLQIGITQEDGLLRQMGIGLGADDLQGNGGVFLLDDDGFMTVAGREPLVNSPSSVLAKRLMALQEVVDRAEPRIYPLYRKRQSAEGNQPATVLLSGFVAARIIGVAWRSEPYPHLYMLLEPCQLVTATAITDAQMRSVQPGAPIPNAYIGKVRLVP